MSKVVKKVFAWLSLGTLAIVIYAFTVGLYPRYFDLSWDEEVQLHDGRVIVVRLKHTYERLHRELGWNTSAVVRDTELSFDAGGKDGRVTQLFKGFHPMFLGQHEGVWFAVLYGDYYGDSRRFPGQDWGELEGPYGQWAVKLEHGKWQPISMSRLPSIFVEPNMLVLKGTTGEHRELSGRRVSLQDKQSWLSRHPRDYGDVTLARPTAASPRREDSVFNKFQGEAK